MKQSRLYVVAAFRIFVFIRELSVRWVTGPYWISSSVLAGGVPAFLNLVPITAVVHVGLWLGWFPNPNGWGHARGSEWCGWLEYHHQILNFHTTLVSSRPYKAGPWGWLSQLRPTSFYYQKVAGSRGKDQCIQTATLLGNPLLWWFGALALVVVIIGSLMLLDWRAGLVLTEYLATLGPWMIYSNRIIFTFCTVVISPSMVLVVIYTLEATMGRWRACSGKNRVGRYNLVFRSSPVSQVQIYLGLFIAALVFLVAVYFSPIWTGMTMPQYQFY